MIRSVALCVVAGFMCGGANAASAQGDSRNVSITLRAYNRPILLDTMVTWKEVLATPAETFTAARHVLDSLKIPIATADSAHGLLASGGFFGRTKLAGHQMAEWLRCGGSMTGDNAATFRLQIAYVVYVDSVSGGSSRVGVALVASGDAVEGASKPPVQCYSTGFLETYIIKMVQLRSAKI